jgi:hypothetical protein
MNEVNRYIIIEPQDRIRAKHFSKLIINDSESSVRKAVLRTFSFKGVYSGDNCLITIQEHDNPTQRCSCSVYYSKKLSKDIKSDTVKAGNKYKVKIKSSE